MSESVIRPNIAVLAAFGRQTRALLLIRVVYKIFFITRIHFVGPRLLLRRFDCEFKTNEIDNSDLERTIYVYVNDYFILKQLLCWLLKMVYPLLFSHHCIGDGCLTTSNSRIRNYWQHEDGELVATLGLVVLEESLKVLPLPKNTLPMLLSIDDWRSFHKYTLDANEMCIGNSYFKMLV